jgi:hypothetical protein
VLPVSDLLFSIMSQLKGAVERSGFMLVDPVDDGDIGRAGVDDDVSVQLLCYRKLQPGAPTTLLELCHLRDRSWITATLWRPDDLPGRGRTATVDDVALNHQSWSYGQPLHPADLARSIAGEIACWLDQPGDDEVAPATFDA